MARPTKSPPKASRPQARTAAPPRALPITKARQQLCPLIDDIARAPDGKVAITVGEEVAAYLVSPEKLAELEEKARLARGPRRSIVGSATLVGDPDTLIEDIKRERARSAEARMRFIEEGP
jgi:hypothetical protein